jgi:hypothetical protein
MKLVWVVSAALSVCCACASSPSAPGQAAATEKKICKSQTVIGQYLPVSVCHTAAEWEAIKASQAEGVKDVDRNVRANAGTFQNN